MLNSEVKEVQIHIPAIQVIEVVALLRSNRRLPLRLHTLGTPGAEPLLQLAVLQVQACYHMYAQNHLLQSRQRLNIPSLQKTPLTFPQANIPAIQKKLLDFNNQLSEQPVSALTEYTFLSWFNMLLAILQTTATEFPLGDGDIAILQRLLDSLQASASSLKLEESSLAVLEKLLEWPISYRFPALDLVRVVAMHQPVPIASSGILFTLLSHITPNANASVKENEINSMLAIRAVANCFSKAEGQKSLAENAGEALETLAVIGVPEVLSKNGKVALATVALNYSIIAVEGLLKGDTFAHLVDFVLSLLAGDDSEVLYRSLVALGNVAYAPESVRGSVSVGTLQALKSRAQTVAKKSQEDRIKKLVSELERKI